jgi:ribose-phosphate pyrophosphokinase
VIGPVAGSRAVIVDDLISAGTTLMRGVKACRAAGAAQVDAFATHGVFEPASTQLLGTDGPDRLIVTDSILPTRIGGHDAARSPVVLPVSQLFAEAIRRISTGGSVVALRELQPKRR